MPWRTVLSVCRLASSKSVAIDDSLDNSLRSLLKQIVPDAAIYDPVRVFAGEFMGIGTPVWVR
jgi:hypothetical protein